MIFLCNHTALWAGLLLGMAASNVGASDPLPVTALKRPPFQPSPEALAAHRQLLESWHLKYDEKAQMIAAPFASPGYHTTLTGGTVHPTRTSLEYAVALLDSLEDRWLPRAEACLKRVLSLQDQNPDSRTFGIWPWFLEEPLEKMAPPDFNWADFCGRLLLQVALDHRSRISPSLMREVDTAIQYAARAIKKRNVGPDYTNIAIMGAYVTLVAGELYDWKEMKDYGRARWEAFARHTRQHGAFNEYNSPTYTVVAIEELGRLLRDAQDEQIRKSVAEIYRLAWEEVALHFHPPSRQWAGPHSRSYSTLLSANTLAFIQRASSGRLDFGQNQPALYSLRLPLLCPADLLPFFEKLEQPRELRRQFIAGNPPVVGTTWLQPEFALGSINRGDLWNQRRSLVAYWGNANAPAYLHLRFLHDGYDFAAMQFFSVQDRGRVLAALVPATNGGDRHISLDRIKEGQIRAKDLRLRLEFGGAAAASPPSLPTAMDKAAVWRSAGLWISLQTPLAVFGTHAPRWSVGQDNQRGWLDLIVYAGEEKAVNLFQLDEAVILLALELSTTPPASPPLQTSRNNRQATVQWGKLQLTVPAHPAAIRDLHSAAHGIMNPAP